MNAYNQRPSAARTPNRADFKLVSKYSPRGDQPEAIEALEKGLNGKVPYQTLLGVTGSGKTFTIANLIARQNRPTLVIAPNKTLAAQLFAEFREFFPENQVRYFVSYYDYYQPEAYIPATDTYIEKDSAINDEIDRMRHSATRAVIEASDAIVVASVSCIYGLGAPDDYFKMMFFVEKGQVIEREEVLRQLVHMQYKRADFDFKRGTFRVRGETIDIFPSDQDAQATRLLFFGDEIEDILEIDSITGATLRKRQNCACYPVSHFVTERAAVERAIVSVRQELDDWLPKLRNQGKLLEAERLKTRTLYDLELLQEVGFCPGIENYSRHLTGRGPGSRPSTLLDYFPDDLLLVIDESHVTVPQLGGMYRGDRSRKETLVNFGFRLPSALDNRPLNQDEFWEKARQAIFVSATPGNWELEKSKGHVIEQVNRPTGLLDPEIIIRPAEKQIDDLMNEIKLTVEKGERVLALTLTKRMSEDLADYLRQAGVRAKYLHSDIPIVERVEILRALRRGDFDVLIGINLLREGLDLVEVSLVAILDADKEGFLRSTRSLIQIMGRAARNIGGRAILYADKVTDSIKGALSETGRRRKIQAEYNAKHGITPASAGSVVEPSLGIELDEAEEQNLQALGIALPAGEAAREELLGDLNKRMLEAAGRKEYEYAAQLRDAINSLRIQALKM